MNLMNTDPDIDGFEDALRHFSDEGVLVNIYLRTFPAGFDVPKEILEQTRNVRIIQVNKGCVVVGPKRPLVSMVIPIEEIAMVAISEDIHRPDEDEIDQRIEEECPTWERDFAKKIEVINIGRRLSGDMSEIVEVEDANFEQILENSQFLVLDVYAQWCQPCKEIAMILEELHEEFGEKVRFAKLEGDKNERAAEELDITAYPTVILFQEGVVKKKIEGSRSPEYLKREIEILIGLKKREPTLNKANGKVNILPAESLIDTIEETPACVIMFYERGDHECQLQSRVMNEMAKEYKKKVLFAKVEVNLNEDLADFFDVDYIPEVYFVRDGEISFYTEDRLTKSELKTGIERLLTRKD